MQNKILVALIGVMVATGAWAVADCAMETYNVTYSCGDGTLADGKTLPETSTATYGETVTVSAIGLKDCNPPSDEYKYGGQSIYVNGQQVADSGRWNWKYYQNTGTAAGFSFKYLFLSDIEIRPKWVKAMTKENTNAYLGSYVDGYTSELGVTWNHDQRDSNLGSETDGDVPGYWAAHYPWGWMEGEAVCTPFYENDWLSEGRPFYVPVEQDKVVEQIWGYNCYCRVTAPFESKWMFRFSNGWYGCDVNCEATCADYAAHEGPIPGFFMSEYLIPDEIAADQPDVPIGE